MQAIMNTYAKGVYAHYNGWTFDIVGHQQNLIMLLIDNNPVLMPLNEILIVDIQSIIYHAEIRANFLGFDYWRDILIKYCKENKIAIKQKKVITDIALPLEDDTIDYSTVNDEDIL